MAIHPGTSDQLKISYHLDYGLRSPIVRQSYTVVVTPQSFANEIAPCRTFLLEQEAYDLQRQGIGLKNTVKDLLVFGRRGPLETKLRLAMSRPGIKSSTWWATWRSWAATCAATSSPIARGIRSTWSWCAGWSCNNCKDKLPRARLPSLRIA